MPKQKSKSVVLITDSIFVPPCVQFNPFAQRYIACPEEKKAANKASGVLESGQAPKAKRQSTVNVFRSLSRRSTTIDVVRTPQVVEAGSDDLSVSDWTDCDEEEFESLTVRHNHPCMNWRRTV
jgi:hypothetical protein